MRFVQRAVPLGVALERSAKRRSPAPTLDLKVFGGNTELSSAPAKQDFVRGHFFALTEAERLRAPDFERVQGRVRALRRGAHRRPAKAIVETYGYEVILLDVEDDRTAPADIRTHAGLGQAFTDRWVAVNHARVARPAEGFRATSAADAIVVRNPAFVPDAVAADVIANAARPRADGIRILETERATFTETAFRTVGPIGVRTARAAEANRVVADYVAAAQL